ncbi:MAG: 2-oxo acid dehydrogenase subunit E2 [Bacteroidota bacterium]|nr:2-oxo acid dehydrogenase subunit E2 [Bacteroidota bacterium]
MAIAELVMPKMGESIMEATILRWHKKIGDHVSQDETVLDIATDKVDSEVPSTASGIITEILYNVNDVVPVGAVLARIQVGAAAGSVTDAPEPIPTPTYTQQPTPQQQVPAPVEETIPYVPSITTVTPVSKAAGNNRFFSPLVLNIANSEGLSLSELERIPGTGADGRVSKKDILQYIADKKAGKIPAYITPQPEQPVYNPPPASPVQEQRAPVYEAPQAPVTQTYVPAASQPVTTPVQQPTYVPPIAQAPIAEEPVQPIYTPTAEPVKQAPTYVAPKPPVQTVQAAPNITTPEATQPVYQPVQPAPAQATFEATKPNVEIIEMDRMRKLIAKHMVDSKHTSPHVTSFAEADVTNMVVWREKMKHDFEKRTGTKITFTPMFIECLIKVMKKYPIMNSSVDGDKILVKNYFNIGMATALPNGNLIVPIIKNAEQLGLVGLAKSVNALAHNARNNKLKPDDTQGGTFTLTNVGTFGSLMGTPIINQPQVAILAVGAIKKRPVVVETDKGDFIGIRHMMYLSMSYDHRIIDGSIGASFLTEVAQEFEKWDVNRELKLVVQEQYVD